MSRDNNSKGIVLILIAMSLFAIQDSLIKFDFTCFSDEEIKKLDELLKNDR